MPVATPALGSASSKKRGVVGRLWRRRVGNEFRWKSRFHRLFAESGGTRVEKSSGSRLHELRQKGAEARRVGDAKMP